MKSLRTLEQAEDRGGALLFPRPPAAGATALRLPVRRRLDGDAANLCLALPRLGVLAIRSRVEWQGPLFAIAMRLASTPGSVIDEDLFRKYVNDPQADAAHFEWLNNANDAAGSMLRHENPLSR